MSTAHAVGPAGSGPPHLLLSLGAHMVLPALGGWGGARLGTLIGKAAGRLCTSGLFRSAGAIALGTAASGAGSASGEWAAQRWVDQSDRILWGAVFGTGFVTSTSLGTATVANYGIKGLFSLWKESAVTRVCYFVHGTQRPRRQAMIRRGLINLWEGGLFRLGGVLFDGEDPISLIDPRHIAADLVCGELMHRVGRKVGLNLPSALECEAALAKGARLQDKEPQRAFQLAIEARDSGMWIATASRAGERDRRLQAIGQRAAVQMADIQLVRGQFDQAHWLYREGGHPLAKIMADAKEAMRVASEGDCVEALALVEGVLKALQALRSKPDGWRTIYVHLLLAKAGALLRSGRIDEGLAVHYPLIRECREVGDLEGEVMVAIGAINVLRHLGRLEEGMTLFRDLVRHRLQAHKRVQDAKREISTALERFFMEMESPPLPEIAQYHRFVAGLFESEGDLRGAALTYEFLGDLLLKLGGETAEIRAAWGEARTLYQRIGDARSASRVAAAAEALRLKPSPDRKPS